MSPLAPYIPHTYPTTTLRYFFFSEAEKKPVFSLSGFFIVYLLGGCLQLENSGKPKMTLVSGFQNLSENQ